ncbi:MAG: GspH/FimT family pseudopilin [Planctomycetota bacterium]|jgi:prepilin-type N-terminal cleavage/methylation domain-containing protein
MTNERTRRPSRAFSLIELVIVLIIVGTIAVIAAPRYARSAEHYRADAVSLRIAADLEVARSRARATGGDVTVIFDAGNDRYAIPQLPSEANPAAGTVVYLAPAPYRSNIAAVSFNGTSSVTFDGYGLPTVGGWVVVVSGEQAKCVLVDGATGVVTVAPYGWVIPADDPARTNPPADLPDMFLMPPPVDDGGEIVFNP